MNNNKKKIRAPIELSVDLSVVIGDGNSTSVYNSSNA